MSIFPPYPEPPTPLGRLRQLAPNAAVRVSPLCLGAMSVGTAWGGFMGSMTKETSFDIMDFFYKSGGNFIDTANNYQNEESETWIGEWMAKHKNRDQIVLATKFSSPYNTYDKSIPIHANFCGNHTKSLRVSVEDSLKKLQTDYIDLLYVHWWDYTTSIPELMQSLNQLVAQGKVLYLGISDTPAWIVSKANQYAADHGLRGFSVYQGMYNAADRDLEREVLPMCQSEGMAVAVWSAMAGGKFKSEEQIKAMEAAGEKGRTPFSPLTETEKTISKVLEKIGKAKGKSLTAVALAFVLQSQPYVFPIIGGRKVEHFKDNIEALTISLDDEELAELHEASNFQLGWPHSMISQSAGGNFLINNSGKYDWVEKPRAIGQKPHKI